MRRSFVGTERQNLIFLFDLFFLFTDTTAMIFNEKSTSNAEENCLHKGIKHIAANTNMHLVVHTYIEINIAGY